MTAGDFLLMTEPREWTMGDSDETEPVKFQPPKSNPSTSSIITDPSNNAPTFKQLGGRFAFDRTHVGLLKEILPSVVEIGCATSGAARVAILSLEDSDSLDSTALDALIECDQGLIRAGRTLVLARVKQDILQALARIGPQGVSLRSRSYFSVADAFEWARHAGPS